MSLLAALFLLTGFFQEQSAKPTAAPVKQMAPSTDPSIALASKVVRIPLIDRAPKLEDFESMSEPTRHDLFKISGFVQRNPNDGNEPTQRTEVYLGYDHQNLYVVWLCFDKEPGKIRAHMSRRENI